MDPVLILAAGGDRSRLDIELESVARSAWSRSRHIKLETGVNPQQVSDGDTRQTLWVEIRDPKSQLNQWKRW